MVGVHEYLRRLGLNVAPKAPAHLQRIRLRPCCLCGDTREIEAHHEGPRGYGSKAPDWLAVPLCRRCHHARHARPIPDWYWPRVYSAQVQILCHEIRRARAPEALLQTAAAELDFVCGICGRALRLPNFRRTVPVCPDCARTNGLVGAHFATEYGLSPAQHTPEMARHIRQLHVFVLAALAARVVGHVY